MIRPHHLRMAARFAAFRLRELHPFEVQAALLNACNLKCVYCKCPEITTRLLSTAQWREVLRGLGRLGTLRLKWQGGEPTLRPDFRELCAESQAAGIRTAVVTNGLAIADDPTLLDHLDELVVSLDSPRAEANDAQRGAGCFAKAVRALDLAVERGLPVFVNMVLTRNTLADMEAMLGFCEARGAKLNTQPVAFGRLFYDDRAASALALTADETREVHRRMAQWKRERRAVMFSAAAYEKLLGWGDPATITVKSEGESGCMAGRDYVHIEPNGDVHPCVINGATFQPKNVVRDGLEEALRSVQRHDCGDCWSAYLNERKLVFGLRPQALLEVVRRG
jgi:MoaA/NifB/PqqE/SkfB family radical SAM enzyme